MEAFWPRSHLLVPTLPLTPCEFWCCQERALCSCSSVSDNRGCSGRLFIKTLLLKTVCGFVSAGESFFKFTFLIWRHNGCKKKEASPRTLRSFWWDCFVFLVRVVACFSSKEMDIHLKKESSSSTENTARDQSVFVFSPAMYKRGYYDMSAWLQFHNNKWEQYINI